MNPPFSAMIVNSGACVFLASKYETIASGDTDPTEQILELSYSRDNETAMSSSIVQEELLELTRCWETIFGVRDEVRVRAQVQRNVRRDASGLARRPLPSVCGRSDVDCAVLARIIELWRCSFST